MRKIFFTAVVFCCFSYISRSQDKIYRQNGKIIEAKIVEIGSSEIKYREFNNLSGPIYVLETDRIKKVVYENGKEEKFVENLKDPERYADQKKKVIKLNFLSALYGYSEIGFEKSAGFGKSFEVSVGVIGAGKAGILEYNYYNSQLGEVKRKPFGFFVSGGYKFGKLPDFLIFGKSRATHIMQGTYVKPIAYLGNYSENKIVYKGANQYEVGRQNVTFGAVQLELGRQWVLGESFILDTYWGIGYGFDNKKSSYEYQNSPYPYYYDDYSAYNYANARGGKSPGVSGTWGVKLGWLLK